MKCSNCYVDNPEGQSTCFNCGAQLNLYQTQPTYQGPPTQSSYQAYPQYPNQYPQTSAGGTNIYGIRQNVEMAATKKRNRSIGIILILIGIIFIPIAIFTMYMIIGWIFCPVAGICLLSGIITVATNLSKTNN